MVVLQETERRLALMGSFDIVTVGHFSIDFIKLPNKVGTKPTLGGSPTYVSLAARKLGANVSVISKIGGDFPERYFRFLEGRGIDLSGLKRDKDASTTSFLLDYSPSGERKLVLKNRAPPLEADDIPEALNTKAVHIAPIANEISYTTLCKLKASNSIVSMDPQGLVRKFKKAGNTYLGQLENLDILKGIDVLKASSNEAKAITGESNPFDAIRKLRESGIKIIIITRGADATLLFAERRVHLVPSAKPRIVVDTTGSGDVFVGTFLAAFVRGEEPLWCACEGSAAASFVVEKFGPSGFGSLKQVYKRAAQVYNEASVIS
jgi:sugar/nucleoside kinase (ribokinase family)